MLASQKRHFLEYEYDFAKDGGAVGAINLRPLPSGNDLAEDDVIVGFFLKGLTTLASSGSPTVTFGNGSDPDGFSVDFYAAAAANAVLVPGMADGALLWNTTNDCQIPFRVTSATNTQNVSITVGTAALTAGKFRVYLEVIRFN